MESEALAVYSALPPRAQLQHTEAWFRVEQTVRKLPDCDAIAIEYARGLYCAELAKGLPADLCERRVMAAYT